MVTKTVLIADDDADIRLVIKNRLERLDCRIIEAGTANDAVLAIRSSSPDIVLLDWNIPPTSGQQVLNLLRNDRALDGIKVIIITGEDKAARDAVQLGAFSSLLKPFGPKELIEKIRSALE
jgi:DNA-binding NtrC family response regulator